MNAMRTVRGRIMSERMQVIRDEMDKVYAYKPGDSTGVMPESPIERLMWLDPLGYRALKRVGINLVADLTRLSVEDRREIPGLSKSSLDRIECSLAEQLDG